MSSVSGLSGLSGVSGVILAGGASRRMGQDKAFLEVDGQPLIALVASRLRSVASEVIIAANDKERYGVFGDRCVADIYPGVGTLGGIHAGLRAAIHDLVVIVACDMPFLNSEVLSWFVSAASQTNGAGRPDLTVLRHDEGVEPLHAAYRKSCLPVIEATIRSGERCAFAFYDQIAVRYVSPVEISALDPTLQSFRNLNTPDQWHAALHGL